MKPLSYIEDSKKEYVLLADLLPIRIPNARITRFSCAFDADNNGIISAAGIRRKAVELLVVLRDKRRFDRVRILLCIHGVYYRN
jgi:hypothetical protein